VQTYRRVIDHFTALVDGLGQDGWSAQTPCDGWTVRDLLEHVIVRDHRLAAMLGGSAPQPLPAGVDLVAQWHQRVRWWADRLADPDQREAVHSTPLGEMTFAQATVRLMTGELTVHTWDLARALGLDERLDPEAVRVSFAAMQSTDEALLRRPGVMGAPVVVPDTSDEQSRFLAFTGRTP